MNALDKYYIKIDNSNYDAEAALEINEEFQKVCDELFKEGLAEIIKIADLDREAFSLNKSVSKNTDLEKSVLNGLSWKANGVQKLLDGTEIPYYWPDPTKYTLKDFEYFEKRYNECKNLFAKTEYGLIVYLGEKTTYSKHQNFKIKLFYDLFELAKYYLEKANANEERKHYSLYLYPTIQHMFNIAEKGRFTNEIKVGIDFIFNTHQNWDITNHGTLRILLDLSTIMSEYYTLFSNRIDFQSIIDKNSKGAIELEKTYVWGAIYVIDKNISIEQKRNKSASDFLKIKASLYEKLSNEAIKNGNMAAVDFCEKALRLYKQIKDNDNVIKLEAKYSELRGKFGLAEIRREIPKEHSDEINNKIKMAVKNSNELEILFHFIETPWFYKKEQIEAETEEIRKNTVLLNMLGTSIIDKYGNKIDVFHTDEERKEFAFWETFTFNYQIGVQTMHKFFIEAFEAGKLNYNTVMPFLETTWYNDNINRMYYGKMLLLGH